MKSFIILSILILLLSSCSVGKRISYNTSRTSDSVVWRGRYLMEHNVEWTPENNGVNFDLDKTVSLITMPVGYRKGDTVEIEHYNDPRNSDYTTIFAILYNPIKFK